MTNFKQQKYNIKRLQPKVRDIELNKCTHCIEEDDLICWICGEEIELNLNYNELIESADTIIRQLETMKFISNLTMTKKEFKAAKKYFDMIPLLKNITELYNICDENLTQYEQALEELDNEQIENYMMSDVNAE